MSFDGNRKMASGLLKEKEHVGEKEEGQGRVTRRKVEGRKAGGQRWAGLRTAEASCPPGTCLHGRKAPEKPRGPRKPVLGFGAPLWWLGACAALGSLMGTSQKRAAVISFTGAARKHVSRETLSQRVHRTGRGEQRKASREPVQSRPAQRASESPMSAPGEPKPV